MFNIFTNISVIIKLILLLLGMTITYFSFSAYSRTDDKYIRDATIGFGVITIGVFIEGLLFEFLEFNIFFSHLTESIITMIGLIFLLISLKR